MFRYKLMLKSLLGIKSPLEKSIQSKLHNLENHDMLDMMWHQFSRYKSTTYFTLPQTIWESWTRR